jgi:uncharacterized protein (TIGR03083 family)
MTMTKAEVWPTIHTERAALAADLEALPEDRWETPSLCEGWSVRDVLAHMTGTAKISVPSFVGKFVAAGFSMTRMQDKDIAAERGGSPADTLARFRAQASSTTSPPGPIDTWLGEVVIHAEDIRRPLGIKHQYATDGVVRVADFYKGSNLVIGAKRRIAGVRLRATDTDWSHGEGPEVSGPIMSLLLAMTGRKAALDDLDGEGVATLSSRP